MVCCGRGSVSGGGGVGVGGGGDALAGRAHGQGGGREVHVERVGGLEGPQLRHLLLEAAVFLRQRLAATLQVLAVHFCLLQLRPANSWSCKDELSEMAKGTRHG